jgi:hypothetical protein
MTACPPIGSRMSVSMTPGRMPTTRMPSRPSSLASPSVIASTAPLLAAYGTMFGRPPRRAAAEEMFTIAPPEPPWRRAIRLTASPAQ